jgi:hypothetical protein
MELRREALRLAAEWAGSRSERNELKDGAGAAPSFDDSSDYDNTFTTTRRFFARSSRLLFGATGLSSP